MAFSCEQVREYIFDVPRLSCTGAVPRTDVDKLIPQANEEVLL